VFVKIVIELGCYWRGGVSPSILEKKNILIDLYLQNTTLERWPGGGSIELFFPNTGNSSTTLAQHQPTRHNTAYGFSGRGRVWYGWGRSARHGRVGARAGLSRGASWADRAAAGNNSPSSRWGFVSEGMVAKEKGPEASGYRTILTVYSATMSRGGWIVVFQVSYASRA